MNLQRKIFVISILGIFFLAGILRLKPDNDFPANTAGTEIEFLINDGELGSSIATNLEKQGVIKSAAKFVEEFSRDPKAKGISAGSHLIQSHIPVKTAIIQLLDPKQIANLVVVKEGSTFSDILKKLHSNDHISKTNTGFSSVKSLFPNSTKSLEGSLFPAHYSFEANTQVATALNSMVEKAKLEYEKQGLFTGYKKYKPFELLTIASMVQIEGDPQSFARVARVIYNRLEIGMPLQLNSTVQYAANLRGKITLSNKATQIDSPYNTYKRVGLPPTAISNPSSAAISATLNPASGDWLYFITVAPGDTRFTKDFAQFSNWNTEFNKNVASGKFK
jgi:UPF0755 protein